MVQVRRRKGRHARVGVPRLLKSFAASRRGRIALSAGVPAGVAGAGLATALWLVPGGQAAHPVRTPLASGAPMAETRGVRSPAVPVPVTEARPARGVGDDAALAYYRTRDQADAAHVSSVVWTGPMLRVYTDLPASDADSKVAIALCETAAAYIEGRGGNPVVFVHAGRAAGYPVLANKMNTGDDCRLNNVP